MKIKKFALAFTIVSIVFSQFALAARFGGGRNRGMQRSQPIYNMNKNNNYSQQQNYNTAPTPNSNTTNNTQTQRRGMGAGTAAALGAVAGAAGGYMLGSHNNSTQEAIPPAIASDTVSQSQSVEKSITNSQIPWGIIVILLVLLVLGLMFFRKKSNPRLTNSNDDFPNPNNNYPNNNLNEQNNTGRINNLQQKMQNIAGVTNTVNNPNGRTDRMADGIESIYFLRQAKGIFLHIQSMNNPENLSEIAKYLTPDLYNEVKEDIINNPNIADFSVLNCNLISSNLENNQLFASVEFNGLVSENPTDNPKPFNEVWNFVKPNIENNKWLVAGIQQKEPNSSN